MLQHSLVINTSTHQQSTHSLINRLSDWHSHQHINSFINTSTQPSTHRHIQIIITPVQSSTHQHTNRIINTSAHQHINTSTQSSTHQLTHQHIQHINASTQSSTQASTHSNTLTHRQNNLINTPTHQHINTVINTSTQSLTHRHIQNINTWTHSAHINLHINTVSTPTQSSTHQHLHINTSQSYINTSTPKHNHQRINTTLSISTAISTVINTSTQRCPSAQSSTHQHTLQKGKNPSTENPPLWECLRILVHETPLKMDTFVSRNLDFPSFFSKISEKSKFSFSVGKCIFQKPVPKRSKIVPTVEAVFSNTDLQWTC
jgi:hypothetical protein